MNYNNRNSGNRRSGRGGSSASSTITPVPPVKFYLDTEKTQLNPNLLDEIAEQQAEKMHGTLNSAQLRRFFGEVKGLSARLRNNESFDRLFPLIKMIRSKVYYACNPKKNKIPKEFGSFLLGGIGQVKDQKDFEAFVLYFEAVVGFMYGKGLVSK